MTRAMGISPCGSCCGVISGKTVDPGSDRHERVDNLIFMPKSSKAPGAKELFRDSASALLP